LSAACLTVFVITLLPYRGHVAHASDKKILPLPILISQHVVMEKNKVVIKGYRWAFAMYHLVALLSP
jgi:hypothetical protein